MPSPRSKVRNGGGSRNVFALPMIHQFEPVLASSPKSYMVANAAKKCVGGDATDVGGGERAAEVAAAGVGSPPLMPSQPQRPKSKEGVESPRVLCPQPPTGISSRTDVDIYRYSQGTEQRMAIRPLFGQRRDSEGAEERPASTKRKVRKGGKKAAAVSTGGESSGVTEEWRAASITKPDGEDDKRALLEEVIDEVHESKNGVSNQEVVRTSSPTPDDCLGAFVADDFDLRELGDESGGTGGTGGSREDPAEDRGPALVKKLDISSYYEPFLQTEGPKLSWMRDAIVTASTVTTATSSSLNRQTTATHAQKSDVLVYKTLGKDLRTHGGRSVLVTVLLSSRGNAHITCKIDGGSDVSTIAITTSDLDQSNLLRRDLPVLTPKWADWIITRVRCDSRLSFFMDLTDAEGSEKRVCFTEIIHANNKEVAVEMVALVTTSSLLISVREITSNVKNTEIFLRADDLRRLALSLGKWSDEDGADQDVSTLFDDRDFLSQLVTKSNVVRLAISCAEFGDESDDSLFNSTCPTPPEDLIIDVPESANATIRVELLKSPNYVQEAFEESKLVGTVALLVQAYVENGMLSTLRHFQQQEAIQLNMAAFMQQAATIDSEAAFNERVEKNLEAARMSKLRVS